MENQKPRKVFQHGTCRASIFTNHMKKNGKAFEIPKVSISKRYQDGQGNWKSSSSLDINDVPKMILALSRAYTHLTVSRNDSDNEIIEEKVEE